MWMVFEMSGQIYQKTKVVAILVFEDLHHGCKLINKLKVRLPKT